VAPGRDLSITQFEEPKLARNAVQALLLIDVQAAFVSGQDPVPQAEPLLASAKNLLAMARQAGSLVVHVQNDGQAGAVDEPGQPGWQLYLPVQPGETVIRKSHDDAFDGSDLGAILVEHRVGRLAIAGVMSEDVCRGYSAHGPGSRVSRGAAARRARHLRHPRRAGIRSAGGRRGRRSRR